MENNQNYSSTYYEKNKDKIKKQVRENYFKKLPEKRDYYLSYYQKNKERIAKKNKEKVVCEHCNNEYARQYLNKHVCLSNITCKVQNNVTVDFS